jgi:hypothetical protein
MHGFARPVGRGPSPTMARSPPAVNAAAGQDPARSPAFQPYPVSPHEFTPLDRGLEQAQGGEADEPVPADDDVVVQRQIEQPPRLGQLAGDGTVFR